MKKHEIRDIQTKKIPENFCLYTIKNKKNRNKRILKKGIKKFWCNCWKSVTSNNKVWANKPAQSIVKNKIQVWKGNKDMNTCFLFFISTNKVRITSTNNPYILKLYNRIFPTNLFISW